MSVKRSATLDSQPSTLDSLRVRLAPLTPASLDDTTHSVEAVLATDAPVVSIDLKTGKAVLEVWRMDGLEPVGQVALIDTHVRDTIDRVKGSVREIRVEGDQLVGRLYLAGVEYTAWDKIAERHVTDVSAGVQPLESIEIKAGQSKEILGRLYTAPAGRSLFVHTKWRLREVSLTPIGSDLRAKIRAFPAEENALMHKTIRKWLEENLQLRTDASDEDAQSFWDKLSDADRQRAEKACRAEAEDEDEEEEEEEEEDEELREDEADKKPTMHRVTRKSVVTEESRAAVEAERIRQEAFEEGRTRELHRQERIRTLGDGLPEELVTRAIRENWTLSRAKGVFLQALRDGRTASVGGGGNVDESAREFSSTFGIQTRSHDADCTVAALGAALTIRGYRGNQDLTHVLGGYQPTAPAENGGAEWVLRSRADARRKKAAERWLDMGDRYRSLSLLEIVDEANRIEGRGRMSADPVTRIRAAMSGSALAAIFTTNVSAQFLGGYLDAADTTQGWITETDVPNFLMNERAIFGKMGHLKKLGRGGTAEDLDTSDWNEQYKIARYAGKFTVDEMDIINDRFGAIEQMAPQDMGLTARQIRPNLVYAMLLANAALNQDSVAVFDSATHGNIVTGVITDFAATTPTANAGPLQDAVTAMGKQRLRGRVLNLRPRFCIAGTDLQWALNRLYMPQNVNVTVSASGYAYNQEAPDRETTKLVFDGRLDPLGCYNEDDAYTYYPWTTNGLTTGRSLTAILAARPGEGGAKTIEVGYLRGSGRAPRIRSGILLPGSGQFGFSWDVSMDIGAKVLDYRGLVLITGAGTQKTATAS